MPEPGESSAATIAHIFTSPGHDFKGRHGQERLVHGTVSHECAVCEAGRGLQGDRYANEEAGHKGQVTFFAAEVLRDVGEKLGLRGVPPGAPRLESPFPDPADDARGPPWEILSHAGPGAPFSARPPRC